MCAAPPDDLRHSGRMQTLLPDNSPLEENILREIPANDSVARFKAWLESQRSQTQFDEIFPGVFDPLPCLNQPLRNSPQLADAIKSFRSKVDQDRAHGRALARLDQHPEP